MDRIAAFFLVLLGLVCSAPAQSDVDFSGIVPLSELVKQGIITDKQAEYIRSGAIGIEPTVSVKQSQERLTISGYLQFYYVYAAGNDDGFVNPPATSEFVAQNLILGVDATLVDEWHGVINANFGDGFASRNYLDGAFIAKQWNGIGGLFVGYKKARFGLEQYTSARTLPTVQRSITTNYFTGSYNRMAPNVFPNSPGGLGTTQLGLGSRRMGVFWGGEFPGIDGLDYYVEITQGYQDFSPPTGTGSRNQLGYTGGLEFELNDELGPILDRSFDITVGMNATYQPDGNSLAIITPTGNLNQSSSIMGIDPYVQISFQDVTLIGEFLGAWVERGRATGTNGPTSITGFNTENAFPHGANVFATYTFDGVIEPVFRFSFINSDGAGIRPGVVSDGPSFAGPTPGAPVFPLPAAFTPVGTGFFDQAQAYYFGLNYYIIGNDVKLSAGYERIQFLNRWSTTGFNGPDASEDVVRIRMQVVF